MRYLSELRLTVDGMRPMFLGSGVKDDNSVLIAEFMNPDLERHAVPQGTLHIFRAKLLWQGCCHEHIRIVNHGDEPARLRLALAFDADFADLFEVRGTPRQQRGRLLPPQVEGDEVVYGYEGLDGVGRRTRLRFEPRPDALGEREAAFDLAGRRRGAACHLYCSIDCERVDAPPPPPPRPHYDQAYRANESARRAQRAEWLRTSPRPTRRSTCGCGAPTPTCAMLSTELPTGRYPYAGVPWYCTTFGRDGILTARELLWIDPLPARGVLAFLAQTQAQQADREPRRRARQDPARGAQVRDGGHARGAVRALLRQRRLDPAVRRAGRRLLAAHRRAGRSFAASGRTCRRRWTGSTPAPTADGFVRYARRSSDGLVQQGWKDSHDSVFHADGRMAEPPIALCEVQGYVYEARLLAARAGARAGRDRAGAAAGRRRAQALREAFQERFWSERAGAVRDRDRRPAASAARSPPPTPATALWTGIAAPEHAARMAERLLRAGLLQRLGHPHGGAGAGALQPDVVPQRLDLAARQRADRRRPGALRPYAGRDADLQRPVRRQPALRPAPAAGAVLRLSAGATARGRRSTRWPARRRPGPRPASTCCCRPAWGWKLNALQREISLQAPRLPEFIDSMEIRRLGVAGHCADLRLQRYGQHVGIDVPRQAGRHRGARAHVIPRAAPFQAGGAGGSSAPHCWQNRASGP